MKWGSWDISMRKVWFLLPTEDGKYGDWWWGGSECSWLMEYYKQRLRKRAAGYRTRRPPWRARRYCRDTLGPHFRRLWKEPKPCLRSLWKCLELNNFQGEPKSLFTYFHQMPLWYKAYTFPPSPPNSHSYSHTFNRNFLAQNSSQLSSLAATPWV